MRSTLSAVATAFVESSWLAALVVVPIYFNVQSTRVFEADKIFLLRSIAVAIGMALLVRGGEEGRRAWTVAGRPLWQTPLVRPALLLTGAYLVATAFSVASHLSLLGSYDRVQGTYTWLSYVTIFAAVILVAREREACERIVTTMLLASLPPAAYAVMQHFGVDPITWSTSIEFRPYGTAGNAIFLSAFVIMVIPLTLARLIEQLGRLRAGQHRRVERVGSGILSFIYGLLLGVQLLAIVYSKSRGPFIGLGVGLSCFFVTLAVHRRMRWLLRTAIVVVLAAVAFLIVLNCTPSLRPWLRRAPNLARLGILFQSEGGSGKLRALVWQDATRLLAANPARALVGYGPDVLFLVYPRFRSPELSHVEERELGFDRCHNETFDALTMTGVLGCAAEVVLYVSLLFLLLRGLGLIDGGRERRIFLGTTTVGGLLGWTLPYVIDGSFRFSGPGLPFGILAAAAAYLSFVAFGRLRGAPRAAPPASLLVIGLLAAAVAHIVELQFGIAVSVTRLLFWVDAGVAVCLCSAAEPAHRAADSPVGRAGLGPIVSLILFVVTIDFWKPGMHPHPTRVLLLAVLSASWVLGAAIEAFAIGNAGRSTGSRFRGYAVTSLVPWLIATVLYISWLTWSSGGAAAQPALFIARAAHVAGSVSVLYLLVFGLIAFATAAAVWRGRPLPALFVRTTGWRFGAYAALLIGAVSAIVFTNLALSRADVLDRQATVYSGLGHLEAARAVAEEALRLQPDVDRYAIDLATILLKLAQASPHDAPQRHDALLAQAVVTLQRAQRNDPLNADLPRNLARLARAQAEVAASPSERARHLDEAQRDFEQAAQLNPNDADLWNEAAQLCVERFQFDKAFALLAHSLQVDSGYAQTYWLRGNLDVVALRFADALADYEQAVATDPYFTGAWRAKATVLKGLNRLHDAIGAQQHVLALVPNDMNARRDLALLYAQTDQPDRALAEARAALPSAKGENRTVLEQLIERLSPPPSASAPGDAPH